MVAVGRTRTLILALAATVVCSSCAAPRPSNSALTKPRIVETTSLLGRPLRAGPPGADVEKLEADLVAAKDALAADPNDPDKMIWVGRRLGYLWRMNEAVELFSRGIELHPEYAPLYRHRGHRYISLRRFDEAIADLEKAADLIKDKPDEVEPDGAPNARGIPLTTTGFNVWYHLTLARYLTGDYEGALAGWRQAARYGRGYDDNLVAVTDWMYITLRRLGRDKEAVRLLGPIHADMEMIENDAYHRRLLMYKGLIPPAELLNVDHASDLDLATLGYGLGCWYEFEGNETKAREIWQRVVDGPY